LSTEQPADVVIAEEQAYLLRVARLALEARVRRTPPPVPDGGGGLNLRCGAFVSLHRQGTLRGCLGRVDGEAPLVVTVTRLAALVADSDPRFDPVREDELSGLEIEISVLTPEREVQRVDEIEIGRHGLIVECGGRRGLLLPQVAVEHGWDRETFLEQTCLKAGVSAGAWRDRARILLFEAQVFSEPPLTPPHHLP
jgi:AmmeMemoRadiSam system protein A